MSADGVVVIVVLTLSLGLFSRELLVTVVSQVRMVLLALRYGRCKIITNNNNQ